MVWAMTDGAAGTWVEVYVDYVQFGVINCNCATLVFDGKITNEKMVVI